MCTTTDNVSLWVFALEHLAYLWNHLPCSHTRLSSFEIFCLPNSLLMTISDASVSSAVQTMLLIQSSRVEIKYPSGVHASVVVNIWYCHPLIHQQLVGSLILSRYFSVSSTMWYMTINSHQFQIMHQMAYFLIIFSIPLVGRT